MKKITIYQSIDDLYFETESECINHEEEVKKYSVVCDYVTLYTSDKKKVALTIQDIATICELSNEITKSKIGCNIIKTSLTFDPLGIDYIKIAKCDLKVFKMVKLLVDYIFFYEEFSDTAAYIDRLNTFKNLTDDTIYFKEELDEMYHWQNMKVKFFKHTKKSKALTNWERYQKKLK